MWWWRLRNGGIAALTRHFPSLIECRPPEVDLPVQSVVTVYICWVVFDLTCMTSLSSWLQPSHWSASRKMSHQPRVRSFFRKSDDCYVVNKWGEDRGRMPDKQMLWGRNSVYIQQICKCKYVLKGYENVQIWRILELYRRSKWQQSSQNHLSALCGNDMKHERRVNVCWSFSLCPPKNITCMFFVLNIIVIEMFSGNEMQLNRRCVSNSNKKDST